MSLYGFVFNTPVNGLDILGREPSFWDQTILGPGKNGNGCQDDKDETGWLESNFSGDVARWKQWARLKIEQSCSCENRGEVIFENDEFMITKIKGFRKNEVTP